MTQELKPRLVVFGVGGAGGNAVDNMIEANLQGVEFVVANTDAQALERSKCETRIQLGPDTTAGLGAGAKPEVGAASAEESIEEISKCLEGAHMVFIAAGLGGGTGTGAAPVIARAAHERGILTVGVVTKPFSFEGNRRMTIAEDGLTEMRKAIDTMIVVPNQNLFRVANERTTFADAFRMADDVLYSGVRGITDLMVMPGLINLDFADVRTIMKGMGAAMMGMGESEGEGRALDAARAAIDNPLLDDVSMKGARGVLISITGGYDMTLFEVDEAANEIRKQVDADAHIILGSTFDPELEGKLRVSVVAAGIDSDAGIYEEPTREAAISAAPVEPQQIEAEPAEVEIELAESDVSIAEEEIEIERPRVVINDLGDDEMMEADTRPDFVSRSLPAAERESVHGNDQVSADQVFGGGKSRGRSGSEGKAGFGNLFGWPKLSSQSDDKNSVDEIENEPAAPARDKFTAPASFDDTDLEIPAFLRRSANR
ncbi:cell division protein FtsZ [Henriciella barbarensis]|uniref:Cell division protein FtsZ n=1 Tax=Henriciella barbarensis TaxID=86342 RepID=A0A399QRJ3_9PROT|nr:cell division protein FtsZ [Henriciella barbarensis]RIJ21413.1 cell division protein FtsZ [Henriciella barbarensis]